MNNVACSNFGKMLHLKIQNGKEAMKMPKLQKDTGGTTLYMKILAIATKGCVQLISNYTYFSGSCFSSVKLLRRWRLQESIIAGRRRRATRIIVYLH